MTASRVETGNGALRPGSSSLSRSSTRLLTGPADAAQQAFAPFSRNRSDLSYTRPLTVPRLSADEKHPALAEPGT
jgi:hypothetical protein